MAFQISPGVNVSEVDLTTVVPAVSTTTGAYAGQFQWGPVNKLTQVTNETELVGRFGKPDSNTATSFFSAANFLAYGNSLQVVRTANSATRNASANASNVVQIQSEDNYDAAYIADSNVVSFVARYPGTLGNSLRVSVCTAGTSNANATFANWEYKSNFSSAPSTSAYATSAGGANDQIHIAVIDEDGLFSNGIKGTVLEVFPFLSKASDAIGDDGSTTYYRNVIRNNSRYVYALGPVDAANTSATWGQSASGRNFAGVESGQTVSLSGAANATVTAGDISSSWNEFSNADVVDVSLLISGDANIATQQTVIDLAISRKDCVAFVSPPQAAVVNAADPTTSVQSWASSTVNRASSYAVADSGWKYQFDKYNNVYRWIPLNGDIAGLCARTDQTRDPWFSPAGYTRGAIKNVVKLAWNPSQAQRDIIYSVGVNPVVSFPGQGTVLYGDKTLLTQPSAFDRINVRRLFIVLEKAIANASKFSLFELNDEYTRAQFIALV